jgi:hypothetical protein
MVLCFPFRQVIEGRKLFLQKIESNDVNREEFLGHIESESKLLAASQHNIKVIAQHPCGCYTNCYSNNTIKLTVVFIFAIVSFSSGSIAV